VRTLLFIVGGFFVYFLLLLTTNRSDKAAIARISGIFIVGWFVVAVGNMFYGVTQAGYGVAEELPIALLIFVPPAIPAAVLWVKNRRV
jgi:hypothetical protein